MADPSEIVSAPLSGSRTLGGPDHASERKAIIETLLFVNGKPLTLDRLCEVLEEKNKQKVRALVAELQLDYETSGRALTIVEIAGGFQMTTRPLHASWVRKLAKVKMVSRVSRAALETAAIIAYKQPITRLEIESVRGKSVDGVLQTLLERRLIKIRGRKDVAGRPLLYGTTPDFLLYFGLKDLNDLPKLEELPEVLAQPMEGPPALPAPAAADPAAQSEMPAEPPAEAPAPSAAPGPVDRLEGTPHGRSGDGAPAPPPEA